ETERKKGSKGAAQALKLQSNPDNFLSSVQVGITLIGIVNGAYGGATLAVYLVPFFEQFAWSRAFADSIAMTVVVILITYVSIVIGELVPKTIALNNAVKMACTVSRPIRWVSFIFYPFVKLLAASTALFNKMIGLKPKNEIISELELRAMLKTASNEGVIDAAENIMHEQVFYFSDKRAVHIMTHRTDVEWVDISKTQEEIVQDLLHMRHSKILACNKRIDDFTGIILMRDFLLELTHRKNVNIEELLQEPIIVPTTLKAQKVLELLKNKPRSLVVVVDEYGSLDGIVTLFDVFENLVGKTMDEDTVESNDPLIYMRDDHSVLVSGEAPIEVLSYLFDDFTVDFDQIDYSTVAGFVFACINKIPGVGDKFVFNNLSFEIMDIDGNKIDKVLIKKNVQDTDEADV
ncbi:MAG TPA: hypothetical protein DDZ78_16150, partial [Porphyromonadaceae bacterium]|nr:hypothetical protein [Porphyromonadaceae bacterium]